MSGIFGSTQPGTLAAALMADAPTAGLLKVEGLPGAAEQILLLSMEIEAATAFQIATTIGGPQYMYPFGDKLQNISIGLMVVAQTCKSKDQESAFGKIWKFYYSNRITPEKLQKVKITYANQTIVGLVTSLKTTAQPENGVPIIHCALSLLGWVEDQGAASSGGKEGSDTSGVATVQPNPAQQTVSDDASRPPSVGMRKPKRPPRRAL